ncbi:hypothetical protein AgCh_010938 [Apium graveolens]
MVIFVVKPQKPIFSLRTVSLDSYKLDVYSNSTLYVSSVVSLSFNAQNPNKIGDVKAHIQVFHITLPMVKVALECDIYIDDRSLTLINAAHNIRAVETHLTSFPTYAQSFSSNCSMGLYI